MHIFFPESKKGTQFSISGEELKHLLVRRVQIGEKVGIIWENKLYLCKVVEKNKKKALCEIEEEIETKIPKLKLTLYQAVTIELKTFETIVQKATELGAAELVPLITERSFRRREVILKKMDRWKKVSKEAMKQSGRTYELSIREPALLEDLEPTSDLNILLDNFYEGKPIGSLELSSVESVSVVVGPEGGFRREEGEHLRSKGFLSVKLEPHVLRADTAATVGVGIIMNLAGS
ncbi:RsmE family RNA methyltransferase [Hydrogenivirga sp. 128-5-R1-1]|uniref:RsmE family RNA methyltransferase n=1 Tax=Hydrogenivirga sp. 128-5-R1-1 TaxID=392423 RepID=UPI00015F3775|nr:RsmE family RNA methyltransferase [Hydrogenivirga sp. 128-5-R1-1]EDP76552.1 hypothetical protein HG1285_03058 [Hydrogenivirga sp. 128-5-R1-1]